MDSALQHLCLLVASSFHILFVLWSTVNAAASSDTLHQFERGFAATHDSSYSDFQPLLSDPNAVFSLGFLRSASTQLDLVVLHLPSSLPVWRAIPAKQSSWFDTASLTFNGTLVLSSSKEGILWSTGTHDGSRIVLLNTSNLQIQKLSPPEAVDVLWQSFDFPADTLVQGQNFTSSFAVFSTNQRFSFRLGANYLALYMELGGGANPLYWKHGALKEANAQVNRGDEAPPPPPLYARVESDGFLAMYQSEAILSDMLLFDSFNRGIHEFRRLTLESDGNLRAYYWNGTVWLQDFAAVTEPCGLPAVCGSYGLCSVDAAGPRCRCLQDNNTGTCSTPAGASGNFCAAEGYAVLRRKGVDLPDKELLGFVKVRSLAECERSCEQNCSCWGSIYSNASGYCYPVNYPIQTLVEGDQRKFGYFKMKSSGGDGNSDDIGGMVGGSRDGRMSVKVKVALSVVGGGIFLGAAVFGVYKAWRSRRMRSDSADGVTPGTYKDLKSPSF